MTLTGFLRFTLVSLVLLLIPSCSDPAEGIPDDPPYVSLNIGDERQLVWTSDSSTVLLTITGTIKRSDSTVVYRGEWFYGTDTNLMISHYMIKDGFFIATELDSTGVEGFPPLPGNPYREQRLAKLYPTDGEYWSSISGDSLSLWFIASDAGMRKTFAGTFMRCYSFSLGGFIQVYYAKGVGQIASEMGGTTNRYLASYVKTGNKIYGSKFPAKSISGAPAALTLRDKRRIESMILGSY